MKGFGLCYFGKCKAIAYEATTLGGESFPHCQRHCISCSTWGGITQAQLDKMKSMKQAKQAKPTLPKKGARHESG